MSRLRSGISLFPLILIVVGGCIGGGIFMTPGKDVAGYAPYASLVLLLWILGGFITLTGALTFAEIGARFPKAGGMYAYLREAYGRWPAFLYGWTSLLAVTSGALAALSLAFASFIALMVPMSETGQTLFAIGTLLVATFINVLGVKIGQAFTAVFTSLKLLGILAIVLCGLALYMPTHEIDFSFPEFSGTLAANFLLGLVGVYWAYGGWHHVTFLSEEVINPQRNLSRALIIGTIIVTGTYLLSNIAYLRVLPVNEIAASKTVAADMMMRALPDLGAKLLVIIVCISIFGSIAVFTMTAPRIYFAMAEDKVFFRQMAYVHPKFRSPVFAIALQAGWAIVLMLFWKTFSDLIAYVTFTEGVFLVLAAASLFIFRKRYGNSELFRAPGYPLTPLFYILISVVFIANGMIMKPVQGLAALILFSAGSLAYLLFRKLNR